MGGEAGQAPRTTQSMTDLYKSYVQSLPGIQNAANQQLLPTALAQLNTNLATTPIQNALNLQQLQQYGLPTAGVNQQIQNSNALAGAQTNLNQITGAGGQAAIAAQMLNRYTNPDYWKNADASANQSVNALNAINLNGLSPGEQNAVERSLNQTNAGTGNLGLNNNTNTISNAINFGGAFNSKIPLLNSTLNTAANTGNMLQNNGFNSTSTALSQPNMGTASTFGSGTFGATGPTGQSNLASNVLGQSGSLVNTAYPAQAQSNYANSPMNALNNIGANACCFIFMEAYYGKIPKHVRQRRDTYYRRNPRIANGYIKMAKWLVPLMQYSDIVRGLVWMYMVQPLTQYGYKFNRKYKWSRKFWFTIWNILGNI